MRGRAAGPGQASPSQNNNHRRNQATTEQRQRAKNSAEASASPPNPAASWILRRRLSRSKLFFPILLSINDEHELVWWLRVRATQLLRWFGLFNFLLRQEKEY